MIRAKQLRWERVDRPDSGDEQLWAGFVEGLEVPIFHISGGDLRVVNTALSLIDGAIEDKDFPTQREAEAACQEVLDILVQKLAEAT